MKSRPGKVRLKTAPEQLRAAGVLLEPPAFPQTLDLPALFGNTGPVEVEIGPGKGGFLLARARRRNEVNFLGIEWAPAHAAYVADRVFRAGATNVRVLCADAAEVFARRLAGESIFRLHIYFPDPWPKRRHRSRRLIQLPFLVNARQALRLGGWVGIVTDHRDYFQQIAYLLGQVEGLAEVAFASGGGDEFVGSNFEKKYAAAGRGFHAIAAIRRR